MDNTKTGTREWAEHNENCIKGCRNNCRYCYAKGNGKSLWTCRRTLEWGHSLLTGGGVDFNCVIWDHRGVSKDDCDQAFQRLFTAHKTSSLPEKVNPKPFDDFLFRIRMKEILDNHIAVRVT